MNKFARMLIALVVTVTPLSAVAPAQAETCQEAITLFSGTPFQQTFPRVCGEEARLALWNNSLGPYLDANSAPAAAWSMAQAAAEEAARVAAAAEEAARIAAEEAARVAAAAAADAANCADAITLFPGTPWARTFPAVCTAAGIQGRSEEVRIYSENIAIVQQQQSSTNNGVPNPADYDCNLEIWRDSAICTNPGGIGTPPVNPTNPADALNCALPQNAVLPICGNQGPLTFPDGTLNCANPVNVTLAYCMNKFTSGPNGGLDCTQPELRNLPACINGTAGGLSNAPVPPTIDPISQPLTFPDGTLNCANPTNATTTTCNNLFNLSANGSLDCSRPELRNLPACVNGTAPGGPNAPPPPTNVSAPTSNVPATTGGVVAQPNIPNAPGNSGSSSNQVASEKVKQNKEDLFPDADGEEEAPEATLTVTYSKTLARYIVKVDSNLAGESLILRGVKKGAKSIKFTLNTDEDGVAGVRTKTKLAGFTLSVYFGSTKLDSVKVS